ncbi:MAG TPA: ABC transporter permease [Terracidiphilus sp.]|jgi:ABC-type multidrug transport system permease subunit
MSKLELSSLYQLTMVRFRLVLREPEAIFWIFIFPILLAVGLGIAFRNRPADVLPVAATTPQLAGALAADKGLRATEMDESAGAHALATGNILLLAVARPGGVEYRYDDTNPDARNAWLLADRAIQTAAGRRDAVAASNELVHETGSRYIDFVVPGLLGMNLMGSAMWGLGFSIVEGRQKKLLKRMVASPMPKWQYLTAFLLSRLAMLVIEVVVFLGFARIAFGVPFRGSLWELGLVCVLTSLVFSALGLLVASRAKTMEAVSGLMNLVMLPMWILSGVFFSASRFPAMIQPLVRALPLTAAINAIRGNMLQGTELSHMVAQIAILLAWFCVPFAVSLRIFRWR